MQYVNLEAYYRKARNDTKVRSTYTTGPRVPALMITIMTIYTTQTKETNETLNIIDGLR